MQLTYLTCVGDMQQYAISIIGRRIARTMMTQSQGRSLVASITASTTLR